MDEFWSNLEAIAAVEAGSILEMGRIVDLFLDVVGENWEFMVDSEPIAAAQLLLGSPAVQRNKKMSRQRLLGSTQFATKKSPQWASFLATVLGYEDKVLDLMTPDHVRCLVQTAWMYRYTDERCLCLYLQLLFVVLMRRSDRDGCEDLFEEPFIRLLLEKMCESETGLGLAALKLLGAINHRGIDGSNGDDSVLVRALQIPEYHRVGERLIWHFNRHRTATSQLLTLKLLHLIVSRQDLKENLYLNDLKVLLDIFVRELSNASHQDDRLEELYLMVLLRVLSTRALAQEPYMPGALVRVLRLQLENTRNPHITTLANDCLGVPWLGWNCTVPVSPHASRDNLVLATRVESITDMGVSPFEDDSVYLGRSPDRSPDQSPDLSPDCSPVPSPVLSPISPVSPILSPPPPPPGRSLFQGTVAPERTTRRPPPPPPSRTTRIRPPPPPPRR